MSREECDCMVEYHNNNIVEEWEKAVRVRERVQSLGFMSLGNLVFQTKQRLA